MQRAVRIGKGHRQVNRQVKKVERKGRQRRPLVKKLRIKQDSKTTAAKFLATVCC